MNVLFLTHCTLMAGANRSMLQLIIELRDNYGVTPFVLLPKMDWVEKTIRDCLIENNIPFLELNIPFFKMQFTYRGLRRDYYDQYKELISIAPSLKTMNFELIYSNSSVIDFGGYLSRLLHVKHVWHLREFGDQDYGYHSIFGKTYERLTYHNGDAFIAISDAIKLHFSTIIPENRIKRIYNGIKPKINIPLSNHNSSKVRFLCAGVYTEGKNQIEVLKAVDILRNTRGVDDFHVTFVGWQVSQTYSSVLISFVKSAGLEDYVSFLGGVDGIGQLASTMDVGIMPSKSEAFGRVTVEYMLQNLAVIANNSGANAEIVDDKKTGLIYPCGDVNALSDCMQRLIEDRELLNSLATEGRMKANKQFLSEQNSGEIYNLFNEVLEGRFRNKFSLFPSASVLMKCIIVWDSFKQVGKDLIRVVQRRIR